MTIKRKLYELIHDKIFEEFSKHLEPLQRELSEDLGGPVEKHEPKSWAQDIAEQFEHYTAQAEAGEEFGTVARPLLDGRDLFLTIDGVKVAKYAGDDRWISLHPSCAIRRIGDVMVSFFPQSGRVVR
jgi:hypothetical protein